MVALVTDAESTYGLGWDLIRAHLIQIESGHSSGGCGSAAFALRAADLATGAVGRAIWRASAPAALSPWPRRSRGGDSDEAADQSEAVLRKIIKPKEEPPKKAG